MIDTPRGLKLSCCGNHPDRTDLSCYKIRRLDGTALTVAEVWAELTASQAEIAELRATIRENIATIKTLSEQVGAASELRAKCERLEAALQLEHDENHKLGLLSGRHEMGMFLVQQSRRIREVLANPGGAHE